MQKLVTSPHKFDFKFHSAETHGKRHVDSSDRNSLVFTFPELKAGDCLLQAGFKLTIFENGCYHLYGHVRSTDDNDIWHMRIYLMTRDGNFLCAIPPFAETLDFNTGKAHTWQLIDGTGDICPSDGIPKIAQVFNSIGFAVMHASC